MIALIQENDPLSYGVHIYLTLHYCYLQSLRNEEKPCNGLTSKSIDWKPGVYTQVFKYIFVYHKSQCVFIVNVPRNASYWSTYAFTLYVEHLSAYAGHHFRVLAILTL